MQEELGRAGRAAESRCSQAPGILPHTAGERGAPHYKGVEAIPASQGVGMVVMEGEVRADGTSVED